MRATARVKWRFQRSADVVSLRDEFEIFRCENRSVIPQNPPILSLRGGRTHAPDVAIFDETIRHSGTKYGKSRTRCRQKGQTSLDNMAGSFLFCILSVLPCFATECHASGFKIATAALRPRNDIIDGFCGKIGQFSY